MADDDDQQSHSCFSEGDLEGLMDEDAVAQLQQALRDNPHNVDALLSLADYYAQGRGGLPADLSAAQELIYRAESVPSSSAT